MNSYVDTNHKYFANIVSIHASLSGGSDYGGAEESFTLQGESDEIFDIILSIINDDDVERPESEVFTVTITSSSPLIAEQRLVINPGQAVVTIIDDDGRNLKFYVVSS